MMVERRNRYQVETDKGVTQYESALVAVEIFRALIDYTPARVCVSGRIAYSCGHKGEACSTFARQTLNDASTRERTRLQEK